MIREFLAEVKTRGLARTNRYEVRIPNFPSAGQRNARLLSLFCDAVNLPGMNIATTPNRFYGDAYEMPYERMFDPVTLSFYMDSGLELKTGFDIWMARIINPETRELNYYKNYVQDIEIRVINVDESEPYGLKLYEAYPKSINSIQLDATGREVMKLQVTMQYRYWMPMSSGAQATPLPANPFAGYRADPRNAVTGSGNVATAFPVDMSEIYPTPLDE